MVQRRPLALLALLAAAPQRLLSRDKLIGHLWPEADPEHARHLLSATLHILRKALGEQAVISTGDDLRLNAAVVWSDVGAFQAAVDAGEFERAVRYYAGTFLDSFYLRDASGFERWADGERDRLQRRYAAALEALAENAEAQGDHLMAVEWWKRLAAVDPYSSRTALRLMRALVAAGERAVALRHARIHEELLRRELDAAPNREVQALAERLRIGAPVDDLWPDASERDAAAASQIAGQVLKSDRVGMDRVAASATGRPESAPAHTESAPTDPTSIGLAPVEAPGAAGSERRPDEASGTGTAARKPHRTRRQRVVRRGILAMLVLPLAGWGIARLTTPELPLAATAVAERRFEAPTTARFVNLAVDPLYLKGRYFLERRTLQDIRTAVSYFERAIDQRPNLAPAYSGLAMAYASLSAYRDSAASPEDTTPALLKTRAAALHALQIDSTLAEAHLALALFEHWYAWDWSAAGRSYRRAIVLDPGDAAAHHWYGLYLADIGRPDDAVAELRKALRLDPLSLVINRNLGYVLYCAGRYWDAVAQFRATLELEPDFTLVHAWLRSTYVRLGLYRLALAEQVAAERLHGGEDDDVAALERAFAADGWPGVLERMLASARAKAEWRYVSPTVIARMHARLGQEDEAIAWLERAYRERSVGLTRLQVDPAFDALRMDPRFEALLRKVGFPGLTFAGE